MTPVGILRRLRRAWRAWQAAQAHERLVEQFGEPPWPVGAMAAQQRLDKRAAARARTERPSLRPDPLSQIY